MIQKLFLALSSSVLMLVACSSSDDTSDKKDDTSTSSSSSGGGGGGSSSSSSSGGGSSSGAASTCKAYGEACTYASDCQPVDFWQCSDNATGKYSPSEGKPQSQCVSGRCFDWRTECDATCAVGDATCTGVVYSPCD